VRPERPRVVTAEKHRQPGLGDEVGEGRPAAGRRLRRAERILAGPFGKPLVVDGHGVGKPPGSDEQPGGGVLVRSLEAGGPCSDGLDVAAFERLDDGSTTGGLLGEPPAAGTRPALDREVVGLERRLTATVGLR